MLGSLVKSVGNKSRTKEMKACPHNDTFDEEGYPYVWSVEKSLAMECSSIKCCPKRHEMDIYSKMPDNIPAETKQFVCLIHCHFCINSGCETNR